MNQNISEWLVLCILKKKTLRLEEKNRKVLWSIDPYFLGKKTPKNDFVFRVNHPHIIIHIYKHFIFRGIFLFVKLSTLVLSCYWFLRNVHSFFTHYDLSTVLME